MGEHLTAGLQFGATFILFAAGGYWLDSKLGTLPWCLVVCSFLGFAGALISLVRRVDGGAGKDRPRREESTRRSKES
ncbi:MAG: AtpZ/AtpI family protein [Planctomycetes bacterium]|nr:AtpZ/AtpI family protein [Planctomycetota bacterium]